MTLSKKLKNTLIIIIGVILAGGVLTKFVPDAYPWILSEITLYLVCVIIWGVSLAFRITHVIMRNLLISISFLIGLWFIVIICRYGLFNEVPVINRYLWYVYYVLMIAIPTLSFQIAVCSGRSELEKPYRYWFHVAIPSTLLAVGVLTNDLHEKMFRFSVPLTAWNIHTPYRYSWLYYVVFGWIMFLLITSLFALYKYCDVKSSQKRIWIPISFFFLGVIYNVLYIYFMLQSHLAGILIYRLSDFFCLMTIAFWESCIQIGLIQSNEGFDAYFWNASLNARIVNANLDTVYMSKNALPLSRKQLVKVLGQGEYKINRNLRVKANKVRGGYAYWLEDLSEVNKLNEKIEDINEQLLGEYTLIRAEADLKEKKARLDTQNKLYDHIADVIRPKLLVLEQLLFGEEQTDSQFNKNLAYACVLNAYIKRRSNLMLIAENEERLPIAELRMSVAETMEKLRKCNVVCQIFQDGDGTLGKDEMFLAYVFLEEIIERAMPDLSTLMVHLTYSENGFLMQISLETPTMLPEKKKESLQYISGSHAEMFVEEDSEDSNAYVCLSIKEEEQKS